MYYYYMYMNIILPLVPVCWYVLTFVRRKRKLIFFCNNRQAKVLHDGGMNLILYENMFG